jgi:DNA-binding response OmpR family regulator
MACRNPGCLGNYDFDNIAFFAKKRFVDGYDTITLLKQAKTQTEKEEIALVCMLDVEDDKVKGLQLGCNHTDCKVTNCRELLKKLIDNRLQAKLLN